MKHRSPDALASSPSEVPALRYRIGYLLLLIVAGALLACSPSRQPPLRIGVLYDLSGGLSVGGHSLSDAVRLATEELNAAGGVLGRRLELVLADARSQPTTAAREAERLITRERVDVLFACWTSACRKAVKPVVEKHRHLMVYAVQYEGLEQSPHILYTGSTANQQIVPGTRWAFDRLGRRVFLVGSDYVFPRVANHLIADLVRATDGDLLGDRYRPLGSTDFTGIVEEIRRVRPDVVFNTINGSSNQAFFQALAAAGLHDQPVVSFSVGEAELQAMPELRRRRHYAVWSYFQSLPGAANQRFIQAWRQRYGADRVTSDPSEAAYAGVKLWAQAVEAAGTAALDVVNLTLRRQSLAAPSGVLAVDGATRHLWKTARIGEARPQGGFDLVLDLGEPLRPTPFPATRNREDWLAIVRQRDAAETR